MRTDSNAHTYLRREPIGRRLRVPAGAQVKQIPIERGPNGETGTRGDYVVASAQVLAKKQIGRTPATTKRAPVEPWQTEAWELRDETGELRFIGDRQARSCSQVRLYVGKKETPTGDVMPIDDGIGAALGHALFANLGQTEQTLKRAAQHLIYNGESLQVIREDPDTGALTWDAHSVSELTGTPGRWKLNNGVDPARDLGDDEILIRTWTAHPQWGGRADAPVRAILPIARELRAMSQYISAQMDSRLAGAGVLLIPDDLQSMHSQGGDDDDDYSLADELTDYMVTPIKDRDSAASIVPIMLTGNGDSLDKVRHISFATELDQQVPDLRDESIRRVGLGMDSDPSVLLGQGSSNHWCMDTASEVYTRRGWVGVDDIQIGDECLSLDHETGLSVWKPVIDLYRAEVVNEPMLSVEGRFHSSLTTMGHRWPVVRKRTDGGERWDREWMTSAEIADMASGYSGSNQLPIKIARGALHALPTVAKYDDAFVELVAWLFTEGGLSYREGAATPHRVAIYQSHEVNADNCARIRSALTTMYGPARTEAKVGRPTNAEEQVAWWREVREGRRTRFVLSKAAWTPLVEVAPHRMVSFDFIDSLTHAQLLLFMDTAVRGDGWRMRGKTRVLAQKDPAMLDAFERAAILAGYTTTRRTRDVEGFHTHEQHTVSVSERVESRPRANTISMETYTGTVWCPTVADTHTVMVRRRGHVFFTGQSAWAVDENEIKFAVQPIVAVVCHALTVGLLRPLLVEQGVPDPDLYSIWYDATPLLVRPDRSKDAQALYDKDVIGAAVLRRENGFDDEDAPTDVEQDRKLLLALLQSRPDWADKLLPALGLVVPGIGGAPEEADEAAADTETAPGAELASPDSAVVAPEPDNGPPVPGETEASR